eukprot:3653243-Pleurochrysis_carterae.AAC.1
MAMGRGRRRVADSPPSRMATKSASGSSRSTAEAGQCCARRGWRGARWRYEVVRGVRTRVKGTEARAAASKRGRCASSVAGSSATSVGRMRSAHSA